MIIDPSYSLYLNNLMQYKQTNVDFLFYFGTCIGLFFSISSLFQCLVQIICFIVSTMAALI